jgi:multiple antibiotic resistance protein
MSRRGGYNLNIMSFEYALLAFTTIFTMVNPLGVVPVYTSLTATLPVNEANKVAVRAVFTAFITMILFALFGNFIFDFFHISINSLRIVAGILFFMTGFDLLQAKLVRTKTSGKKDVDDTHDFAFTPLAIPVICGPGAISASIVLMSDAGDLVNRAILVLMIASVLGITLLILLSSRKVTAFLGESGNKVMMRIMGLIVMVIAVEFFFSGLTPIVRSILNINL